MRKEIEKDEIFSDRVDTVSEMSYGGSSGTETVSKQYCDLEDYPGNTAEGHIENTIHQRLIEIMHDGAKGDNPTLRSRNITLVTKYLNEINKMLKCIPVRSFSELKYLARTTALLVCEKVGVKTDYTIKKNESFWKRRIEKDIAILRKDLSRIDDWFKRR